HKYDQQKAPLTAYLTLVATSTVIDHLRRDKSRQMVPLEEKQELADSVTRGEIEADQVWQVVVRVLSELTRRDQSIIRDFLEGEKPETIGTKVGIKASPVYTIVYRFRRALQAALRKKT